MSKRTSNGKISKWRNYFHEYDDRRIEPIDDMLDAIHDERDRADKAEARLDKVLQLAVDLENGRDLVGPQTRTGDLIAAAIREAIA